LMRLGFLPENPETEALVSRWRDAPPEACLSSRSVDFLKRTGRTRDLDFILAHIDDLRSVFTVRDGEVHMIPMEESIALTHLPAKRDERPEEVLVDC
jgi:2-phosphosulfolactate phosphatase